MAQPSVTTNPSPADDRSAGIPVSPAARPRRRPRRRWLVALLGLVVIVGIASVGLVQFLSPAPTTTIWQAITAGISDGAVPKQTALEAFAYLYDVAIPDVTVPAGIEGGDEPTDGSGAVNWVRADWDQLTSAQQAVIDPFLVAGPNDQAIPISSVAAAGSPVAAASPAFQLDVARNVRPIDVAELPDAPAAITTALENELQADIVHIGPRLGMPVLTEGNPLFPNIELIMSDSSGGKTLMQTTAVENALHYEPCEVTVYKNAWSGATSVTPTLHVLMTHEVVHCYQNVVWGSVATSLAIPPWIVEGTALYLAADDTKVQEPMIPSMWEKGYFIPETALTNRSYDAFGYYSLLAHEGRDLWSLMLPAWQAAAKSATRSDAFIAVLNGDAVDIRDNWAELYVRKTSWGDPWIAYGFGLPAAAQVVEHIAQAQPAPGWTGSLASRSNTVLNVDSTAGEVVIVSTDGLASVHDDAGHMDVAFQSQRFCTVSSCVCPKGTKLAGQDMASEPMTISFVAAFNAPEGGSKYSIVSETLAELCGQASPPPTLPATLPGSPSPGPCTTGCSDSNGDPHMLTVNNVAYDFQAAGEFTLLRSADGSVDIQARQEPFGDGGDVSTNTAIAAKVGSHRVGVYLMPDSSLQAHVDGQVVDLSSGPLDLGGGASISNYSDASTNGFEVVFPDGTKMWALSVAEWGINAEILPSASLKADGTGLLGPAVAGGLGVPALPDGTALPSPTDDQQEYDFLYGQFADAWRVTDATTLFDYDPGKSTASYTIKPYPAAGKMITLADLTPAQRAAGEAACQGITNPVLHDDCVLDVGVTGDAGFADTYASVQAFDEAGLAPVSFPSPSISSATAPPAVVSGAVTVTKGTAVSGYAVGPDDTVYMSVQTGDNAYSLISFDPKAGKIIAQVSVPAATEVHYAAGSLWLPGLETDSSLSNCSVTRFDPATLAEQATIPIPCADVLGPIIASDGSSIWFEDNTNYDSTTGKGAVATRIDPVTDRPANSVPMPSSGGYLIDSQGAIFYTDPDTNNYYVLTTGSTTSAAFELIGNFPNVAVASGAGLWTQSAQGKPAEYFTHAGSPDQTLPIRGTLVGGDASAAYAEAEVTSPGGGTQPALLRYGIDGSAATRIALPPKVGGTSQSYLDDLPPDVTSDGFVKIWAIQRDSPRASILLQWAPLP